MCDETNFINSNKNIETITNNIIDLPNILSFHISINEYKELKTYNDIINYYFLII